MAKLMATPGSRYGWRGALLLPGEYFAPSLPPVGRLKVWTGTQWAVKPAKVWTGTAWLERPVRAYTGSGWV